MNALTWNFLTTGENTGKFNMQLDETLAQHLAQGLGMPTLRLYRWQPWAISLGRHQDLMSIDTEGCARDGIDVVRRPTGGRAILHAQELTYSVVMPSRDGGIHRVYCEISEALVEGLRFFGVDASLQRSQPDFPELYKSPSSIPCFSSSARYEVEWNGKKLAGSAQRRYGNDVQGVVLQHGSILCGPAHCRLADYVKAPDEGGNIRAVLEERTTDLSQITGGKVDMQLLADCIKKGFQHSWGVKFNEVDPLGITRKNAYA